MEPSQPRQNTIWAVVDDLFFSSRIRATAAALGKDLILFESPAGLQGRSPDGVSMLILDLNARTFDALAFLRDAKCDPRLSQVPTIGFFSHVDKETRLEAERIGIDRLLTKSEFTKRLPGLLEESRAKGR
jgi:CheY-like chemotaxis protein